MAIPNVAHATYDEFRAATISHSYDLDGYPISQPYQCWDSVDLLYQQADVNQYLYTAANVGQGEGTAKSCWLNDTARALNGSGNFRPIYNVNEIKRGDIIVFNTYGNWYSSSGHIGFADEDYNNTDYINILSQNFYGKYYVDVDRAYLGQAFLGVFRFIPWETTPPTPTPTTKKRHFPWPIAWENWQGFINN